MASLKRQNWEFRWSGPVKIKAAVCGPRCTMSLTPVPKTLNFFSPNSTIISVLWNFWEATFFFCSGCHKIISSIDSFADIVTTVRKHSFPFHTHCSKLELGSLLLKSNTSMQKISCMNALNYRRNGILWDVFGITFYDIMLCEIICNLLLVALYYSSLILWGYMCTLFYSFSLCSPDDYKHVFSGHTQSFL